MKYQLHQVTAETGTQLYQTASDRHQNSRDKKNISYHGSFHLETMTTTSIAWFSLKKSNNCRIKKYL
ncbi:hypothetical protein CISIN_1g035371mg [Citrus sinensis]|uniref:Uncharacterized protein n=1 Tax=Citrus sinensis TaxID=2711 RepID=A0A067EYP5_CITSI|nr:hypothetical protein CISIN_1g035371mg [Citrus sinensis]